MSQTLMLLLRLRPPDRRLQSTTSLSRELLTQSSVELENYLRFALSAAHATAIDAGALNGPGTSNKPIGLLQIASLPTVSIGASGGTLTYDHLVSMEQTIGDAGSEDPNLVWITAPSVRAKLRKSYINTGSIPVWAELGPLGYQGYVSKNCPANLSKGTANGTLSAILLGAGANMLIPMWGTFELITDVFTAKKTNMVQFTTFQVCDILVKRIGALCAIVDAA